jgi:hypothetical protein
MPRESICEGCKWGRGREVITSGEVALGEEAGAQGGRGSGVCTCESEYSIPSSPHGCCTLWGRKGRECGREWDMHRVASVHETHGGAGEGSVSGA